MRILTDSMIYLLKPAMERQEAIGGKSEKD